MSKIVYLLPASTADDLGKILEGQAATSRLLASVLEGCKRPVQTAAATPAQPPQDPASLTPDE